MLALLAYGAPVKVAEAKLNETNERQVKAAASSRRGRTTQESTRGLARSRDAVITLSSRGAVRSYKRLEQPKGLRSIEFTPIFES